MIDLDLAEQAMRAAIAATEKAAVEAEQGKISSQELGSRLMNATAILWATGNWPTPENDARALKAWKMALKRAQAIAGRHEKKPDFFA